MILIQTRKDTLTYVPTHPHARQVGEITLPAFLHIAKKYRIGKPPHLWDL